jgi:hypothetical protein
MIADQQDPTMMIIKGFVKPFLADSGTCRIHLEHDSRIIISFGDKNFEAFIDRIIGHTLSVARLIAVALHGMMEIAPDSSTGFGVEGYQVFGGTTQDKT